MSADLNFEAEPYGGFYGSHDESAEEFEAVVRDHRGGGASVAGRQRAGYAGGTVVRDHRGAYGGTTVSVSPPGGAATSARTSWPWGGRGGWKIGEAGVAERVGQVWEAGEIGHDAEITGSTGLPIPSVRTPQAAATIPPPVAIEAATGTDGHGCKAHPDLLHRRLCPDLLPRQLKPRQRTRRSSPGRRPASRRSLARGCRRTAAWAPPRNMPSKFSRPRCGSRAAARWTTTP